MQTPYDQENDHFSESSDSRSPSVEELACDNLARALDATQAAIDAGRTNLADHEGWRVNSEGRWRHTEPSPIGVEAVLAGLNEGARAIAYDQHLTDNTVVSSERVILSLDRNTAHELWRALSVAENLFHSRSYRTVCQTVLEALADAL